MKNLCPVCGFQGEYDEMMFDAEAVIGCMMCEGEELEEVDWDDYTGNMPCDNSGYCGGESCPNMSKCKGWE